MLWEFRLPSDLEHCPLSPGRALTILDIMDFVSNSVMMPIVGLFLPVVFVGFFVKPKTIADEVKVTDGRFVGEKLFTVMIKWITPVFLVLILLSSVANAWAGSSCRRPGNGLRQKKVLFKAFSG